MPLPVLSVAGDLASLDLFLPQREVLAQQLHDEGGVPVRFLVEGVQLGGGVVEGLLGEGARLGGLALHLEEKDRVVERQSKTNWVCALQFLTLEDSILVAILGVLNHLLSLLT